jgi:hypothetical protein
MAFAQLGLAWVIKNQMINLFIDFWIMAAGTGKYSVVAETNS